MVPEVELCALSGFQPEANVAGRIHLLDSPEFPIRDPCLIERRGELDPVAFRKLPLLPVVNVDTLKAFGIVGRLHAVLAANRNEIFAFLYANDCCIVTGLDADVAATPCVTDDISPFVGSCALAVRAGQFGTVYENRDLMTIANHFPLSLETFVDVAVNLKAALVVRRHHEASFGIFEILRCHRIEALFRIRNFMNALLLRQAFHGVGRLARRGTRRPV